MEVNIGPNAKGADNLSIATPYNFYQISGGFCFPYFSLNGLILYYAAQFDGFMDNHLI